jgi:FtsP/CotA-like multicopper oxidase with cupredoxin domain
MMNADIPRKPVIVKNAERRSIKFMPLAAGVALAVTWLAGAGALAGTGTGAGVTLTNAPKPVPTYYANSPSGPAPTYVNGVLQVRTDGSALPFTSLSGTMLRKFVDTLPGFGAANANNLGQYIPVAVAEKWVDPNGLATADDYYEIAAVEFRERLHSDLPAAGTHLRGYVQLETAGNFATSKHIVLRYPNGTAITDPAKVSAANTTGQVYAYDNPHHLGPIITATQGVAVRVKFSNYLPSGAGGNLFLPVDATIPGAGLGPDGVTSYTQNRTGMHLVGGQAPWISAGSPNQWIAPALTLTGASIDATGTTVTVASTANLAVGLPVAGGGFAAGTVIATIAGPTSFTTSKAATGTLPALGVTLNTTDALVGKGASAQSASDMLDPGPGAVNLVFPNDMSARFTFIQDRTSGLTRLNAYAGLEAGYLVTDPIEQTLITGGSLSGGGLKTPLTVAAGTLPSAQLPLIIEDKTFVPANIAQQDALWNTTTWGGSGDLWFPHVYEPNQDPTLANGTNPAGRWDYGPLFWPIFPVHPLKSTLPSPSFVPEAYMDTPLVNGTAYPTVTVEPKAYRVRILNASNDRYYNLGLYKADPTPTLAPQLDANGNPVVTATGVQQYLANTEVRMIPAGPIDTLGSPPGWDVVNNVQLPLPQFGTIFPWNINAEPSGPTRAWPVDGRAGGVPDPTTSGPDFVVIGNDGGLLPQGTDIPSQPVTYEQNRRSITVTNIYGYGVLLGPSERADTVVDFSGYAGQTLILYNDSPAPTPFNDPRDDYYTGDPDHSAQGGAYSTLPGYGPNTRTIMQIKVGTAVTPGTGGPLNAAALAAALPAAYAASQPAPIVPEAAYNAAFGTTDTDTYGHVATGSAAQPSLIVNHSGNVVLTGFSPITSGGAGTGSGSGYLTAPAVVLSGGGGTGASACATVNAANQVASVTFACPTGSVGSGYTSAPTATFVPSETISGITVADGGAGYTAPVTVTLSGGGLNAPLVVPASVTLSTASQISTTLPANWLVSAGSGYLVPPAVSFTGGGTGAIGTATIGSSPLVLGTALLNAPGSGYTNPLPVVSAPQIAGGTTATASVSAGFAVAPIMLAAPVGAGFDQPAPPLGIGGGTTVINFSLPQLTGGLPPVAAVTLDPTSGAVTAVTFSSFGSGYTSAPTATISDGLGNSATVVTALNATSGQVFSVSITGSGSGYTAPATISFTDATGLGATASASLASPSTVGSVTGLAITNGGGGYSGTPTAVFTDQTPAGPNHTAAAAAQATVSLVTATGAITGVTLTNFTAPFSSAPTVTFSAAKGTGALATAGLAPSGVGAQATVLTSTSNAIPVVTKAEQELYDDWGRYNSTAGVELPFTTSAIQTTIPLNYIDSPTEILGDDEIQIWKLVDNGFWSNSIHFSGWDVQLVNRVGWDGTVKAPATDEVGWKDTIRLNPLEDVLVAMRAKSPNINFGQPRSTRQQDPTKPSGTANFPTAPALPVAGTPYASGLGFTADPNVVTQAGTMNSATVGVGTVLLATSTNTSVLPGSTTGNYDNEFIWGSAILGHSENDFTRPVVFNAVVIAPAVPLNLADTAGTGTLTWTDPTPPGQLASAAGVVPLVAATLGNPQNEIGFQVLQAPITNLSTYALGAWTPGTAPFAAIPANVVSFQEPAALIGPNLPQYYAYEVVAFNAAGVSNPSNVWYEAPPKAPTLGNGIALLTPSFVTPATSTADVALTLQWQDNAVNETNYIITKTGGPGATLNPATHKVTGGLSTTMTAPRNPLPPSQNTAYVDPASLVEGSPYEYDIVARNAFGDSAPVLWDSLVAPISVPLAPSNVLATATIAACATPIDAVTKLAVPTRCKPDDVVLTWTDNAFNETSYSVSRSGGNVAFVPVTLPANTASYRDTTAQEAVSYTYTVSARNTSAAGTVQSSSATAAVSIAATVPTLPTNLIVKPSTALDANGMYLDQAVLTWSDNAYNEVSYQVLRDGIPVGNAIIGAGLANNPFGSASSAWSASPVLTYTDTGVADGTTHVWAVQAANALGTTASANVTATMPGIVIAPPTNLITTPSRAGLSIGLQWTDQSTNETDFMVEESVSATGGAPGSFSNWTIVQPIVARSPAQTLATGGLVNINRGNVPATPGFVYSFRVSARNLANHSDSHPYLYGQSSLQGPVLTAAPTLAVPTLTTARRVGLSWTAVTPPAGTTISYIVYANGVQLVRTNLLAYNYRPTVAALQAGITYTVNAVATAIRVANPTVFGSTMGPASNAQTLNAKAPAAPAVPTGLAAAIAPASGAVTLNWTFVAPTAGTTISYLVSVNGAAGVPMVRGAALAVPLGASYSVSVASVATALGLSTPSAYSAPLTIDLTAAAVPSAPAALTVTATTLNWTAPVTVSVNATLTYTVQKSIDGGVTWSTLTAAPIAARTLAAASPAGSNYQYRVQALATRYGLAASLPSAWTTTTFNTAPAASTTPVAALVSTRNITVSFTNVSTNITGFTVQRRLGGGGGAWTTIAPAVTANGTTYSFTDLVAAAGSYSYRLSATSAGGTTANTAASNAVVTP